jgi:hypothetical protein
MKGFSMRKIRLVILILALSLISLAMNVQAQDTEQVDDVDVRVVYNGVEMTRSEMLRNRTVATYCALIIDEAVLERGYWDGRYDRQACFDTRAEALRQSEINSLTIDSTIQAAPNAPIITAKPNLNKFLFQNPCAGLNRGTGFVGVWYAGPYPDVCSAHVETYIGGTGDINSVWLEGGSCAQIYIRENYFPPQYTYVDYSSVFARFIFVAWYRWAPKC